MGCKSTLPPPDCPPPPPCDSCCIDCPECPTFECPDGYKLDKTTDPWICEEIILGPSCGDLQGDLCGQAGECPEGFTNLGVTYDCNPCCVKDVMPPPPEDCGRFFVLDANGTPAPGDYRVDCRGSTGRLSELCYQRQEMVHQGSRSPRYAVQYCSDKLGEIGSTPTEMSLYPPAGEALIANIDRFYLRLQVESVECPGRSLVNRLMYSDFQAKRAQHMAEIYAFDKNATDHVCRETKAYDNMKGWCCKCYGRGPNCEEWVPIN